MNYSPYMMPYSYLPMGAASTASRGLLRGLFGGGINFSSILTGTGKVLNIVNQSIPVIRQAAPVLRNAKTMFKVMNEFKKNDTPISSNNSSNASSNNSTKTEVETKEETNTKTGYSVSGGPTFFM
jgi:hypothetical protein